MDKTFVAIACKSLKETENTIVFHEVGGDSGVSLSDKFVSGPLTTGCFEKAIAGYPQSKVFTFGVFGEATEKRCILVDGHIFVRLANSIIYDGISENELYAITASTAYMKNNYSPKSEFHAAIKNGDMDMAIDVVHRTLVGYKDIINDEEIDILFRRNLVLETIYRILGGEGVVHEEVNDIEMLIEMHGYYLSNPNRMVYILW